MSFKDKILNNQSPWGSPPGGDEGRGSSGGNGSGARQDPPSIDDIIKNFQKTINKFSGGKSGLDFGARFWTFVLEKMQKRKKRKSSFREIKYTVS